MNISEKLIILFLTVALFACQSERRPAKIFLAGDSTVADYSLEPGYAEKRYPVTGWGQVFQRFLQKDSLKKIPMIRADSAIVDDRARGGRSTRTFFEEGRWRAIYEELQPGDLVLVQFGHNDAAETKPERYVNIAGYKEFLRLFVMQTREKGGIPVLITPVTRNYPWTDEVLGSAHGEYPNAMKEVAGETNACLIDLTAASAQLFTRLGRDYVTEQFFMNLPADTYPAYPEGQKDNTHFQPAGAKAVAGLVFQELQKFIP